MSSLAGEIPLVGPSGSVFIKTGPSFKVLVEDIMGLTTGVFLLGCLTAILHGFPGPVPGPMPRYIDVRKGKFFSLSTSQPINFITISVANSSGFSFKLVGGSNSVQGNVFLDGKPIW